MKRRLLIMVAMVMVAFATMNAQADLPPNAEPGKCYAQCRIPDQIETRTEQVMVRPASKKVSVTPARYEKVTETVVTKEASTRLEAVPARYETVTERVMTQEASQKLTVIPAKYETVEQQVMVQEASSRIIPVAAVYEKVTEDVVIQEASSTIERVPAKWETQTERIEVSPATTRWEKQKAEGNCLSENPDDCMVWCLVEVPASYRTITKQVKLGCATGFTESGDDCIRTTEIPAKYGKRTYQKLVTPATTRVEEIPAKFETIKVRKLVSPATTQVEEIAAKYEDRTYRKLVSPATTTVINIPQETSSRTYDKLVQPASVQETDIPAEYTTVSKTMVVKKGGFTEWREVVCSSKITSELVRKVQVALKEKGYDPGPIDNILGSLTKAALVQFQKDNQLPIGQLDLETLKALGVQ